MKKAEEGTGGVGYERLIVTAELVDRIDTKKFIPVVRQASQPRRLPKFLGPRLYADFSEDSAYEQKLDELAREIHGIPLRTKPPLGPNPYTATVPSTGTPPRVAGLTGLTTRGESVLDDDWFGKHNSAASDGLKGIGRTGAMEIRAALHDPVRKSQLELLTAVRSSEIRTFGWPIGILLENRPEYRPKPVADGIVTEVAITEKSWSGESSYDYWALRNGGDFFLLQSLFEDERAKNHVFFDTRIVRITEALLFLGNLYRNLGVAPEARLSVRIVHSGLAGRTLTSASRNRDVLPASTAANRSEAQLSDTLSGLREHLVEHVINILEPMFMLFDFKRFEPSIYEDIVSKFAAGHVA